MGTWQRDREWNKVYSKLDEMGIDFRKDKDGDIDFPEDQYEIGFGVIAEAFPEYALN